MRFITWFILGVWLPHWTGPFFLSCPCRGRNSRGECPVFQADVQGGFFVWAILWRKPACEHCHRKGPLWGGNASAGFPDQAARGSDTPDTRRGILRAQSTQLHQLWDQDQRRACSEELQFGCRGKNFNLTSLVKAVDFLVIFWRKSGKCTKEKNMKTAGKNCKRHFLCRSARSKILQENISRRTALQPSLLKPLERSQSESLYSQDLKLKHTKTLVANLL